MKAGNIDQIPKFEIFPNHSEVSLVNISLINIFFPCTTAAMSRNGIILAWHFLGNTSAYLYALFWWCSGEGRFREESK